MVDTLYFDGRCPLCRREVGLLRKLADDTLGFQDIHTVTDPALPSQQDLLLSLHLRRANGAMVRGLEANVAVWQHTAFGFIWKLLLLPGVRVLANRLYQYWAARRYERLYACSLEADSADSARPDRKRADGEL